LLMPIFFLHMLPVFLSCYCSFPLCFGKRQHVTAECSLPGQTVCPCYSYPALVLSILHFLLLLLCVGRNGRARVMGEEEFDKGL
jgi:hypothetical protein